MRTFAARQRDIEQSRYLAEGDGTQFDPRTIEGAKGLLSTRGGKKAAQQAVAALWTAAKRWRDGYLLRTELVTPSRVLEALHTLKLVERMENAEGRLGYRLTPSGVATAAKAQEAAQPPVEKG